MGDRRRLIHVFVTLIVASGGARAQQPQLRGVVPTQPQSPAQTLQLPAYHALVIGIDNYDNLPKLGTAVSDANAIAKLLHERFGFEVNLMTDSGATYQKIVSALSNYAHRLQENDNLLIYYAGHGMYDKQTDTAYWLPVEAEPDDDVYWIIASVITTHVHALRARHVLVVSDSCYSGMLTRSVELVPKSAGQDNDTYVSNMLKGKSRHLMSSGGNEPVADGGAPGHSVFSWAFLQALDEINERLFTATELFNKVQRRVAGGSEQVPQYMPIRDSGDMEGDFVFFQSQASANAASPPASEIGPTSKPKTATTPDQVERPSRIPLAAMRPQRSQAASQAPPPGAASAERLEMARGGASRAPATSVSSFGGTWIEINSKNPENPKNLVLQQEGSQVEFAGFRLTVNQGIATWTGPQSCATKFQHPGYDYSSPNGAGTVTLKMTMQGSILIYEKHVDWKVPCNGHAAGEESHVSTFQRAVSETATASPGQQPESGFRVTQVTLYPTPGSYTGHCPVAIHYRGVIVASGSGTVRYSFARSDGAIAPVFTLHFDSAGAKEVSDTWQVGGAGRSFELWQALKILDPQPAVESNKAITDLVCQDGDRDREDSLQDGSPQHGHDSCKQGFVWREAVPHDHVCVTPAVRKQAAIDNAQASDRKEPNGGRYGPDTCQPGFVWREATPYDHVCVIEETRAQAKSDNSQAAGRILTP